MTQVSVPLSLREQDPGDRSRGDVPPKPDAHRHSPCCGICGEVLDDFVIVGADGLPTREGWRKIGELFRKEMAKKQRKGKGGAMFDYITARQVAKRLDDVVGPGNWQTDWQCLRVDHPVAVRVGIGVFGAWKWDAGYSNNPDADDENDKAYEDEPLKAAVSDGFKRAAVHWGIGRFLYADT